VISWQSRGRNGPSGAARLGMVLLVVLALCGAVLAWVQAAGVVHLDGPLAFGPALLIGPLAAVLVVAGLRLALTWMAG
jgi:hypothetical protein